MQEIESFYKESNTAVWSGITSASRCERVTCEGDVLRSCIGLLKHKNITMVYLNTNHIMLTFCKEDLLHLHHTPVTPCFLHACPYVNTLVNCNSRNKEVALGFAKDGGVVFKIRSDSFTPSISSATAPKDQRLASNCPVQIEMAYPCKCTTNCLYHVFIRI